MPLTGQSSWFEFAREALALYRAFQDKTRKVCPNPTCPLKLNHPRKGPPATGPVKITKESVDAQIANQKRLYKRNHPNG